MHHCVRVSSLGCYFQHVWHEFLEKISNLLWQDFIRKYRMRIMPLFFYFIFLIFFERHIFFSLKQVVLTQVWKLILLLPFACYFNCYVFFVLSHFFNETMIEQSPLPPQICTAEIKYCPPAKWHVKHYCLSK